MNQYVVTLTQKKGTGPESGSGPEDGCDEDDGADGAGLED